MTTILEPMAHGPPLPTTNSGFPDSTVVEENDADSHMETSGKVGTVEVDAAVTSSNRANRFCGNCCAFENVNEAKGYNCLGLGRGGVVMSNIFLASSLIYLACDEAGGIDPETNTCDGNVTVRGMKPSALITNIAVFAGLLSALFMPMFGAIIDFTDHRKLTGVISAIVLTMIQATQIGTLESTWFTMAILQAIAAFIYQIQVLTTYAYLPEMARIVGQGHMTNFTAIFTMSQFASQASFNIVVIAVAVGLSLSTVPTAMASQTASVIWCLLFFTLGWRLMPTRPAKHTLDKKKHSILTAGFVQNWNTAKAIWKQYKKGLKWYLLALIFAEASAAAITSVSVVYLADTIGLETTQIAIFFLIALICTIPGAKIGSLITARFNPNTSWKLSQLTLLVTVIIGAFTLEDMKGPKELSYIWGAVVGLVLGWFYPTENLFFSLCLPLGQEAELAGFFVYCTQILGWLPPLLFTICVEANISQKYGVIVTSFGFAVSVLLLSCTASWPEILEEAERNKSVDLATAGIDSVGLEKKTLVGRETMDSKEDPLIEETDV